MTIAERYNLSFEAHYRLVTIHPWADGNGRMARLVMNHIQFEFGLLPAKVLKEDRGDYINALIATRENEDLSFFLDFMAGEMVKTLSSDIAAYLESTGEESSKISTISSEKKVKSSKKILDLLKVHPEYSATRIASEIGISAKAVEKHLAKFKAAGTIVREGPDKGGRWIVMEG
ncbi:MAG: Fic family protein, partial [Bacteroidales bacterium]|nr:Fic family protein [Bacteroidales bacterium]